jgi:cytochrome P450/CRP-like cAMP-binding protein
VLVGMDGAAHRRYRSELRPGLTREAVRAHLPGMVAAVGNHTTAWQPGDTLDVAETLQFLVAEQAGLALTGCPVGDHFQDTRRFARTFLGAGVGGYPGFFRRSPRYRRARRRFLRFVHDVVAEHRHQPVNAREPDFVDLLLNSRRPDGGCLSDADVLAAAHMPYSNSLVYTAAFSGFVLSELMKRPEVLAQVRAEADALFAGGTPDLEALRQAPVLRAVLLETQRMRPISLSIPRYVERAFNFEGYRIEAGTLTLTATAVTHFLPEFFPDPHTFDVRRYQPPRNEHRQGNVLVPYGLGTHVCPSAGLVDVLAALTVGLLVHRFDFALEPEDYDLALSVAPFPAPSRDFRLRVLRRREPGTGSSPPTAALDATDLVPDGTRRLLERAAAQAESARYEAGSVVFRQGDTADAFFVIRRGAVEIVKEIVPEGSRAVARLGPGDYFGEIGLLHGVARTATVVAVEDLIVTVVPRHTFTTLLVEADLTSHELAAVVRRRLLGATLAVALPRLGVDHVATLSPHFTWRTVLPGETVVQQGDVAEEFFLIVRGTAEVVSQHPDGRDIALGTLGEGEYFGEIGLLQRRPRVATVRAGQHGPLDLLVLGREAFASLLQASAETGEEIAWRTAERLGAIGSAGGATPGSSQ